MTKEKTFDDLWAEASDYVPQSIEDVQKELKNKFRKNPNSLYITVEELSKIPQNNDGIDVNDLDELTETPIGDYFIFNRFKDYRGVKVYELNDDSGLYLIETKKKKYFFEVYQVNSIKGVNDTLVFVDGDGDMTIYDIKNDVFTEGE